MNNNDNLITPKFIIDQIGPFDLDPCAGENTMYGDVNYFDGDGEDGLTKSWFGFVWCNPPFSQKELWANKMISHNNGILLLPERASAPWFGLIAKRTKCYFVFGKKINFIGGSSSNNIGSVLFPFGDLAINRIKNCNLPGLFVNVEIYRPRQIQNKNNQKNNYNKVQHNNNNCIFTPEFKNNLKF